MGDECVRALLGLVPASARRLLLVGTELDRLAEALQAADLGRTVYHLDVGQEDAATPTPGLPPGGLDVVACGEVLARARDPLALLRRHRRLLGPQGVVMACVANAQHHAGLATLLTGDLPPEPGPWRGFTCSGWLKLFLDAGFAPTLAGTVPEPAPPAWHDVLRPLLGHLGLHPARTRHYLDASHFLLRATPLPDAETPATAGPEHPLSFVACVSDEQVLKANLLSSPCLRPDTPHEVILARGCPSAADGLNEGLARASRPLVVCLHQDVYLPDGWDRRFLRQYRRAEQSHGPLGVAGVYGVCCQGEQVLRAGHVVDRDRLLREPPPLPAAVDTLDELLLAVPRGTPLRFDPQLAFHFYGADLCLQAAQRGLKAVALDALCLHNSRSVGLPPAFYPSAERFAAKWRSRLPVATPCVHLDAQGRMRLS